jgi:SAM-dependent methyltransferase
METRTPMSQDSIDAAQAARQERIVRAGIPGATSISILRRVHDARFATRYFRGDGIDVGGGIDSIALYQELFPNISTCFVYDQQHGDAQFLANVRDASFDFLYSSHCLEHLRDPVVALGNWLRVVKPGGHLVVQVPDEDLYEQGHWPSRFNGDHKLSFTMAKTRSWSPVSVNVLDLLRGFAGQAQVLSVQLLDQGYRHGLAGRDFDQTRTPMAECGIEFVLRALPR